MGERGDAGRYRGAAGGGRSVELTALSKSPACTAHADTLASLERVIRSIGLIQHVYDSDSARQTHILYLLTPIQ